MTDWDAIFGEAALGLDVARADLVQGGPDSHASTRRSQRSSVPAQPGPHQDRAAGQAAASSAAAPAGPGLRSLQTARPSLKLATRPAAPTTNPEAIFRREALEFRVRGRATSGGVVRLGARWIHWSYRLALVLVAAALASLWLIRTDESASGPAVIDDRTGTVAVLLPATAGPDLANSRGLTVALPSGRPAPVSILHIQLADDAAIKKAGLAPPAQPAILVTGRLAQDTSARPAAQDAHLPARASVVLRSESLADILGRQFDAILSQGTAP